MSVNQISVFLENRAGQLSSITSVLTAGGIDLRAINIAETSDYGVLRLIADDSEKAARLLREQGFLTHVTQVVVVAVPDRPGGLNAVLEAMADEGIDIEYMYSIFGKYNDFAYMVFRVGEPDKLSRVLAEKGFPPIPAEALGIR